MSGPPLGMQLPVESSLSIENLAAPFLLLLRVLSRSQRQPRVVEEEEVKQKTKGPGWFGLLMEFFGMTWPQRARESAAEARRAAEATPRCSACQNPTVMSPDGWRCPHHPNASVLSSP